MDIRDLDAALRVLFDLSENLRASLPLTHVNRTHISSLVNRSTKIYAAPQQFYRRRPARQARWRTSTLSQENQMREVVIASAARTPVGAFNGGLSSVPASYLGTVAVKEALKRAQTDAADVDEVLLGQILTAGTGQNPARQAAVDAGIPVEATAVQVNQLCGSGLRTVAMGMQSIKLGDTDVIVAGGQESMSQAPHCAHLRNGQKMGDLSFIDTMIKDGLWDAFNGYHMGNTAENVAEKYQITREEQDEFAVASQQKAGVAMESGAFADEIVPVTIKTRKGEIRCRHRRTPKTRYVTGYALGTASGVPERRYGHGR